MKCPKCSREISDRSSFCGYCGAVIDEPQEPQEMTPDGGITTIPDETNYTAASNERSPPAEAAAEPEQKQRGKKKRTGLKVLLVFAVLAIISGGAFGFLAARGIVDWKRYFPAEKFVWTDRYEGVTEDDIPPELEEELEEKKETIPKPPEESEEHGDPAGAPGELPDPTDPPDGPAEQPEESVQAHYAKYTGAALLIVDDKAHLISEHSIAEILERAMETSAPSDYSIMIVLTNDLFGMTMEEYADGYYANALENNQGDPAFSGDGFLFLVDAAGDRYSLAAFGSARNKFSNSKKSAIFDVIQPHIDAGDFEAAILELLENTPQ